jgi:gamma-carbonic anhydrase
MKTGGPCNRGHRRAPDTLRLGARSRQSRDRFNSAQTPAPSTFPAPRRPATLKRRDPRAPDRAPDRRGACLGLASHARNALTNAMSDLVSRLDRFLRKPPTLGQGVYVARGAVVVGDVTLGDHASVWYNAVLRGDLNRIVVGHSSNIQDNAVLHLSGLRPCVLGNFVTVGHAATIHACTIADEVLVGMGATILDGAVIGRQSIVGANALVSSDTEVPPGSLVLGAPARVARALRPEEIHGLRQLAEEYVENAAYCLRNGIGVSSPLGA